MSRAEEINSLVKDIVSRQLMTNMTGMDGITTRKEVNVSLMVNKFLLLCRIWDKYQAKFAETEKIAVKDYIEWAKYELKGYRGVDIKKQGKDVQELSRGRTYDSVFVRYSVSELELAYNNNLTLPLKDGVVISPADILPILRDIHTEIIDVATNLGKEIDIKYEQGMTSPYGDLDGLDYNEADNSDIMDGIGDTFGVDR